MATKKKTASKSNKTTEQIRKEAIAQADKNIAAIEAKERGETPPAEQSKRVRKTSSSSRKKASTATKGKKDAKPAESKPAKPSSAKTTKAKVEKPVKEKKLSGLDHAANVLIAFKEPLNAVAIAERAIEAGWKTNGATPHATLYAAMVREIQTKGADSRFKKMDRGLFAATGKGKK